LAYIASANVGVAARSAFKAATDENVVAIGATVLTSNVGDLRAKFSIEKRNADAARHADAPPASKGSKDSNAADDAVLPRDSCPSSPDSLSLAFYA
jgi:hypothetical protein